MAVPTWVALRASGYVPDSEFSNQMKELANSGLLLRSLFEQEPLRVFQIAPKIPPVHDI